MDKLTILVTGCNGQLGTHLRRLGSHSKHEYLYTDVEQLDITSRTAVQSFVDEHRVDVVVNCAAYTNVDRAESDPETAMRLNADAVGNLADAMAIRGGMLIHISTDYVFGGNPNNTPCSETEQPNPTGVYGSTKLAGEVAARRCKHIIIRTAWLYSEYGRNFLLTMLNLTATHPTLNVVYDQVGTPTYAGDLARAIYQIVEDGACFDHPGLYHFSNEGVCSWFDFAVAIAHLSGHTACRIQPCRSSEFPSPVHRPAYSVLDKSKFRSTFHIDIPYWTDSLQRCLVNIRTAQ